jgi:hypothetical protein
MSTTGMHWLNIKTTLGNVLHYICQRRSLGMYMWLLSKQRGCKRGLKRNQGFRIFRAFINQTRQAMFA